MAANQKPAAPSSSNKSILVAAAANIREPLRDWQQAPHDASPAIASWIDLDIESDAAEIQVN
jgi:hypothetical protein